MPTTVEIQAFKFQELTDKAKQRAMERLCPDSGDWWYQHIYDQAKEDGEAKGFRVDDISFTGFWSQGDGASWEGRVDMVKWLELNKPDDTKAHILAALMENGWVDDELIISTSHSRYAHSNTMLRSNVSIASEGEDDFISKDGLFKGASITTLMESLPDNYVDDISDEILAEARSYANDIYEQLRKEYEYLCSEEHIVELCNANDYLFDENGKFI